MNATNDKINRIIGDSTNLKKICIVEQKTNESFLNLNDNEKTQHICEILKLNVYNLLSVSLLSLIKDYNTEMTLNGKQYLLEQTNKLLETELLQKQQELVELQLITSDVSLKRDKIYENKIQTELQIKNLNNFKYFENQNVQTNKQTNQENITKFELKLQNVTQQLHNINIELNSYIQIEQHYKDFNDKNHIDIQNTNNEILVLKKQYKALTNESEHIDLLLQKKQTCKSDLFNLKIQRNNLQKDIITINNDIDIQNTTSNNVTN